LKKNPSIKCPFRTELEKEKCIYPCSIYNVSTKSNSSYGVVGTEKRIATVNSYFKTYRKISRNIQST
jgi:hypothetical protein